MKGKNLLAILILSWSLIVCISKNSQAVPIGTAFTYQGRFIDNGSPADGVYDFEFELYDASTGGTQLGSTITKGNLQVTDGYFTTELDFGAGVFDGNARWVEIGVRPGDSTGAYTTLSPRQELTPTPYTIHADVADSISGTGTNGYVPKFTDSTTIGDSAIYESGGNVGIGTSSPEGVLNTVKSNAQNALNIDTYDDGSTYPALNLRKSDTDNIGTLSITDDGDILGLIRFHGVYTTPDFNSGAYIYARQNGSSTASRVPADMYFVTQGDATANNYQLVLKKNGNVGIGTASPAGTLDVNGSIYQRGGVLHADYVFETGYELESIDEHSQFMWKHGHLQAIPKAEVDVNGQEIIELGAHHRGTVEELEKAHIYIEQLNKRMKVLEEKLAMLEAGSTKEKHRK